MCASFFISALDICLDCGNFPVSHHLFQNKMIIPCVQLQDAT